MGDEADRLINDMLDDFTRSPIFIWEHQGDSRTHSINAKCVAQPITAPEEKRQCPRNCKCGRCVAYRIRAREETYRKQHASISIEQAFKKPVPYDVPTHIVCNRCQATGLHWGLKDGKPEMREEGGWPHKCKKIEGVSLNLPNILDPQ